MPVGGRLLGQREQGVEVVVEEHRLPGVQQHLARAVGVLRSGPELPVEPPREGIEPVPPGADQPGRGVLLAALQPDLAGQQQLAAAQQPPAGEGVLGAQHLVAAPGQVHAPDPAGAEAEAGMPRTHHRGGVVPRPAAPGLAHPLALVEGAALRRPLVGVPPGHVQQLGRLGRHRQRGLQVGDLVGLRRGVPDAGTQPHETARQHLELGGDHQVSGAVGAHAAEPDRPVAVLLQVVGDAVEGHRPRAAGAAPEQAGTPGPAGRVLREHGHRVLAHHDRVDVGHAESAHRRLQRVAVEVAEVGSPVQHAGQARRDPGGRRRWSRRGAGARRVDGRSRTRARCPFRLVERLVGRVVACGFGHGAATIATSTVTRASRSGALAVEPRTTSSGW